ncbi:hypothetical protein CspeluHIS016_0405020 [Cutaneotrichosporon spelunceum]|uniref:ARM repeat-containing protein n=1 Tax=Cutaneotrichosporon spelunceum TaxID=1672016 RepID=A0AAD3YCZ8_9TREE|nr:hypothetical protein CspeluHIS016_0405020 [Cutaneotrichosporon spelunceum]
MSQSSALVEDDPLSGKVPSAFLSELQLMPTVASPQMSDTSAEEIGLPSLFSDVDLPKDQEIDAVFDSWQSSNQERRQSNDTQFSLATTESTMLSNDSEGGPTPAQILVLRKENQLLAAERDVALQKIQQLTAMPLTTVDLIIKGKVDYLRMNKRSDFELVNCLVSIISQEQFNLNVSPGDMFTIANDMFGVHVLVKAIGLKELEVRIVDSLVSFGIFKSMQTGARKVWRPILEDLPRVATNEFGHYLIKRFLGLEPMFHAAIFTASMFNALAHSILTSYPPLATNYYGVRFVETVIDSNRLLQRANAIKYLNSLCSQKDGRIPAIVDVANSSVGRGHLQFVLRHMPRHGDGGLMGRVRSTCRQFQTTLRNSQSGNELLRRL